MRLAILYVCLALGLIVFGTGLFLRGHTVQGQSLEQARAELGRRAAESAAHERRADAAETLSAAQSDSIAAARATADAERRARLAAERDRDRLAALVPDALAAAAETNARADAALESAQGGQPADTSAAALGPWRRALAAGDALRLCTEARRTCAASLAVVDSARVAEARVAETATLEALRLRSVVSLQDRRHVSDTTRAAELARALDSQRLALVASEQATALATDAAHREEAHARALRRQRDLIAGAGLVAVILALLQ